MSNEPNLPVPSDELFTEKHIVSMRTAFGQIKTVDPGSETYRLLKLFIHTRPLIVLKQLAASEIKWVSYEAQKSLDTGDHKVLENK